VGLSAGTLSGVDVFSANMVRRLVARGIPAHVLLSRPFLKWYPMPLPSDVPRHELEGDRHEPWGSRWWTMIRYLEDQAPCIYIPNYDYEYSCVSPKLSAGVGIVGIVHSDDPVHYEHVARLGRYWDAVVAVSGEIAEKTVALDPSLAGRLFTIPYGIPLPQTVPERRPDPAAPLKVVYAGRLDQRQKRVLDLPPIFERLAALSVPAELTIIGDGPCRDDLIRACDGLIVGGSVRLLGTLPNPSVLQIFERSDVVILTSAFEGLPICLLEAMSRGCVPVVTDLRSGVPDLVMDGVNGFRLPVGDSAGFSERLAQLQADPDRRRTMSERASQTVREGGYDTDRMVDRYVQVFEGVLDRARRGLYRRPRGRILYPRGLQEASWKDQLPPRLRVAGTKAMRVLRRAFPRGRAANG
jgi:glycosyltransferase involved in cell wall biosynthesis